jgi:hypothetical protein
VPAGLATPVSIHDVASQRGKEQEKGDPEVLTSSLSGVVQAEKEADGAAGRISQGEEVRLGIRSQHRQVLLARAHERILFVHSCAAKHPLASDGGKAAAMFWSRLRKADNPFGIRMAASLSLRSQQSRSRPLASPLSVLFFAIECDMGTLYNPTGLTTNCGFCAIAHALSLQGITTDADKLYLQTLERLGIPRQGNTDPIPRQLIFPDPLMDGVPVRVEYTALAERGHDPSSYTITSVASANNLRYDLNNRDLSLQRQFFDFCARTGRGAWNINDFVQSRLTWLQVQGQNPSADGVRRHLLAQLSGHSIIGSKTVNHFITMQVDTSGKISAYDPQDGRQYDGASLQTRMRTLDLVLRLR